MPCDPLSSLTNAISGSYAVYYMAVNQVAANQSFGVPPTSYEHYVGAIKADTFRIMTGVESEGVFSDFLGPNTPVDYILTPKHDRLSFTLIEINRLAAKRMIYPYSTTGNGAVKAPGQSGEKPAPGRLQSSYEGRLRLVPLNGNLRYWDSDLTLETGSDNPSGFSIRDYFHVALDPEAEVEENYRAGLDEIPITLMARLCRDTATNQWRTHQFVQSLNSPLT